MFASLSVGSASGWEPSAADWAELRAGDDEYSDFEFPRSYDGEPGAVSALLLESTDISSLDDAGLINSIKGFGRLASWAQAMQSAATAQFARRRPPAWVHDDGVAGYASASRYVAEEFMIVSAVVESYWAASYHCEFGRPGARQRFMSICRVVRRWPNSRAGRPGSALGRRASRPQ
jgi:hypothetical protein